MAVESLVGQLPDNWSRMTLGEACERGGGGVQTGPFGSQLHASDYVPVGIPSIMPQNIGDNRISEDGIARITEEDAERLERYRVRIGDIVYSRRGDVERRALIREKEDGWLCGTGCLRVRFGESDVDPIFASYYLGHPNVREWIVRHAHGATMPNLNTSILSALPFVVPPRDEQHAIAHILGTLDDKIELNRRMNETLEAMARAIFKSWFVDFDPVRAKARGEPPESICRRLGLTPDLLALFPDRLVDSELGEIPEGWYVKPLEQITSYFNRGLSPKYVEEGGILVLNQKCVRDGRVDMSKGRRHDPAQRKVDGRYVEVGDVLVNSTGVGTLGRVAQLLALDEPTIVDSHVTVVRAGSATISSNYLGMALLERQGEIEALGEGSTGQTELSRIRLGALPVLIPPRDLCNHFDGRVIDLRKRITSNERQSVTLKSIRDTLLPKLLSGELRVPIADAIMEATA